MNKIMWVFFSYFFITQVTASNTLSVSSQQIFITQICEQVVSEALMSINIDIQPINLPTKRALIMSNDGETDGEICRVKGLDNKYTNLIRIDPSIIPLKANVFTIDKDIRVEQNQWDALQGYATGVHAGHFYSENGTKNFSKVTSVVNDIQLIEMLRRSRIDIAVMITPDALFEIKKAGYIGQIKMLEPPIAIYPLHFYVHKKNKHLINAISKSIKSIVDSGRSMEIYNQYLSELNP